MIMKQQEQKKSEEDYIKILSLNDDPEYIKSCLKILTRLEKAVINILHDGGRAMSVREIRNLIIMDNLIYFQYHYTKEFTAERDLKLQQKIIRKTGLAPPLEKLRKDMEERDNLLVGPLKDTSKGYYHPVIISQGVIANIFSDIKKEGLGVKNDLIISDDYKTLDKINKIFSKHKIETPSYSTIESALFNLNNLVFVIKRPTESKRIKYLWAINPRLDLILKKLKT